MDKIRELTTETAQFAKDIENEAKRITWPSRPEAIKSTLAVISYLWFICCFFCRG